MESIPSPQIILLDGLGSEIIVLHPGKDSSELEGAYWMGMRRGFEAQVRGQIEVII